MFVETSALGAYTGPGSFVEYYLPFRHGRRSHASAKCDQTVIGRVKGIVSVCYRHFVLLQRMQEIPVKGGTQIGEDFVEQIFGKETPDWAVTKGEHHLLSLIL